MGGEAGYWELLDPVPQMRPTRPPAAGLCTLEGDRKSVCQRNTMQTLLESLTYQVIGPAIKRRWFSGRVVPFRRYLEIYEEALEIGVAVGYAHRENLLWLAQLFSDKGREPEVIKALSDLAKKRLSESPNAASLFDFGMFAEESRVMGEIRARTFPGTDIFSMSEEEIWKFPKKLDKVNRAMDVIADKLNIPVAVAFTNLQTVMSLGIGLGGAIPDVAEQFWSHQYEEPVAKYRMIKLREAGLNIPSIMPDSISLAEFGQQMRLIVDAFIARNRPDVAV